MESTDVMPVWAYGSPDEIVRVPADASLLQVADALFAHEVGAVVLGTDEVVGIVTERDLVRALAQRLPLETTSAQTVASTGLIWCEETSTVAEVASEMCCRSVRHVLIERDGDLAGIVSARDLLGVYAATDLAYTSA